MNRIAFWMISLVFALSLQGSRTFAASDENSTPAKPGGEASEKAPGKMTLLPEDFLKKLTEHLKLSGDQQKKIKGIIEKSRPEREKIEAEMKVLHEKIKASLLKTKESIRETLDLDQKDKFDQMMQRLRQGMHGQRGPGGSGDWKRGREGRERGQEGYDRKSGPPEGEGPGMRGEDQGDRPEPPGGPGGPRPQPEEDLKE